MCEMQPPHTKNFIVSCETDLRDRPTMLNVFLYDQKDALIEKKQIPIDHGDIWKPSLIADINWSNKKLSFTP